MSQPISGNDWSRLVPPRGERWSPSRRVSICIPTRDPGPGLRRTLLALSAQTYPSDLIEVVIADDGSTTPVAHSDLPFESIVVRQERTLAFGAGKARNAAGRAATGDILMFLDGDVIPERHVVEAYARWFERSDLVVPMGLCRFVDTDQISDDQLVGLVRNGTMHDHFAGVEVDDQAWREKTFARTGDLRNEAIDSFRVVVGATLAVSARQFEEVGGFRELGVRGVEDTEFGYRLHANGAVLVLDRDATHWHQGRRNLSTDRRAEIDRVRRPYVEAFIPLPGFRRSAPTTVGDYPPVPAFRLLPAGASIALPTCDPTFATVRLPGGAAWTEAAAKLVFKVFQEHPVGVIRALLPSGSAVEITRHRALRRAWHTSPTDDPVKVAAELFGSRWVMADAVGIAEPGEGGLVGADERCDGDDRIAGGSGSVRRWLERGATWLVFEVRDTLRRWAR